MLVLVLVIAVLLVGYRLSLTLHPYTSCEACSGGGHRGAIYRYARRPCHICFGTGQKQRFGARMLGLGTPRSARPWGRWAPPSSTFPTPRRPRRTFGIF